MTLTELQKRAYETSKAKGFQDLNRTFGDNLMLIVSELAEALEEYRKGVHPDGIYFSNVCTCREDDEQCENCGKMPKPEGIGAEIADAVIRIGQLSEEYNIDLEKVVKLKMDYNDTRPFLHGNKKL